MPTAKVDVQHVRNWPNIWRTGKASAVIANRPVTLINSTSIPAFVEKHLEAMGARLVIEAARTPTRSTAIKATVKISASAVAFYFT
jgi:hypothetical protein